MSHWLSVSTASRDKIFFLFSFSFPINKLFNQVLPDNSVLLFSFLSKRQNNPTLAAWLFSFSAQVVLKCYWKHKMVQTLVKICFCYHSKQRKRVLEMRKLFYIQLLKSSLVIILDASMSYLKRLFFLPFICSLLEKYSICSFPCKK